MLQCFSTVDATSEIQYDNELIYIVFAYIFILKNGIFCYDSQNLKTYGYNKDIVNNSIAFKDFYYVRIFSKIKSLLKVALDMSNMA